MVGLSLIPRTDTGATGTRLGNVPAASARVDKGSHRLLAFSPWKVDLLLSAPWSSFAFTVNIPCLVQELVMTKGVPEVRGPT